MDPICASSTRFIDDGDTIKVRTDCGFEESPTVWLRLEGVTAPELSQPGGPESRDRLKEILPYEMPVRITTVKTRTGAEARSFVRYVAQVELTGGRSLNSEMQIWLKAQGYGPGTT